MVKRITEEMAKEREKSYREEQAYLNHIMKSPRRTSTAVLALPSIGSSRFSWPNTSINNSKLIESSISKKKGEALSPKFFSEDFAHYFNIYLFDWHLYQPYKYNKTDVKLQFVL